MRPDPPERDSAITSSGGPFRPVGQVRQVRGIRGVRPIRGLRHGGPVLPATSLRWSALTREEFFAP
ncbi:4-fold beta flower protein [Sorangium atrum]|uniref:4-fold beta flower protein n=1 Tax=Sorangium atrum TaxID=2995308 RepID=UPI00358DC912